MLGWLAGAVAAAFAGSWVGIRIYDRVVEDGPDAVRSAVFRDPVGDDICSRSDE